MERFMWGGGREVREEWGGKGQPKLKMYEKVKRKLNYFGKLKKKIKTRFEEVPCMSGQSCSQNPQAIK